jgi:hypothetical protein
MGWQSGGMESFPRIRGVQAVLVSSTVVMVTYWTLWFAARGTVASSDRPAYQEFENAFPAADGWLTLCLVAAAVSLAGRRPAALLWLLAGGGAGLYLFAEDTLYDLQHGIWWRSGAGGLVELTLNVVTLVLSIGLLRWAWRHRAALLAGGADSSVGSAIADHDRSRPDSPGVAGSRGR